VPGDNAAERRREALEAGIPLDDAVHARLRQKAGELGFGWSG
jgi:LDH2 family malate/lactate/ureidoglycolate dehydrogenase